MNSYMTFTPLLLAASCSSFGVSVSAAENPGAMMPHIPNYRTAKLESVPDFQIATELPKVEPHMAIYATKAPEVGADYLTKVASRFGMKGEALRNGKGKLAMRDRGGEPEQQTLTLYEASGGYFYRFDKQLHAIPKEPPKLPDDKSAYNMAVDFLAQRDLLPKDVLMGAKQVEFSKPVLSQFDGKSGETLQEMVTGVEVRFGQSWDGYEVTGPGSKLYVALGEEGKVLAVTKMWRQGQRTDSYLPTIPPEQALAMLREDQGRLSIPVGCSTANIEAMSMAYWSESPRVSQRIALPLYRVGGTCYDGQGESLGEFEGYAPAVMSAALDLKIDKDQFDPEQDWDE